MVWCVVFMLRHFFWAIPPQCKHVIVTDHVALRWMSNMCLHNSPSNRQLVRFSWEIHQTGPHIFGHWPGVTNGGPDGLSRLTGTDISIDGYRDRSALTVRQLDVWADCRYIEDAHTLQILDHPAVLLLENEPAWVACFPTPVGAALMSSRVDSIRSELMRQNRARKDAALGSDTIVALETACSGPLSNWVSNWSVLNITDDVGDHRPCD